MASYFTLSFFFIASAILCLSFTESAVNGGGFTVDLHHRDSNVNDALRRSVNRFNRFFPNTISTLSDQSQAEIVSANGEFILEYSLGTPPVTLFGIADTGSDLIWTQCKPCPQCFPQTAPLFDASKSKTYRKVSCESNLCSLVGQTSCDVASSKCEYSIQYGDQSSSSGDVAIDTLTLGSTTGRHVSLPGRLFGCGHDNQGTFGPDTSGIVGLGRGQFSLVSQLGASIGGKFSYCLIPLFSSKNTSKLNFGENGVVSGRGTVSTPLISNGRNGFYWVTLEAMTVGGKKLDFINKAGVNAFVKPEKGNIIIDSGTTLTLLTEDFYDKLESEVASKISLVRVKDPNDFLSLCYKTPEQYVNEAPIITAHFKGGANVNLTPVNTFVKVSDDIACFAFRAVPAGAIFGNIAQSNFQVGYDLNKNVVSFKPTDCTKL